MLRRLVEEETLNLYFRFTPEAWGQGYARELGQAAIHCTFNLLGFDVVHAVVREQNAPSRSVLEKLGLSKIGEIPASSQAGLRLRHRLAKGAKPPNQGQKAMGPPCVCPERGREAACCYFQSQLSDLLRVHTCTSRITTTALNGLAEASCKIQ